ncbi:DUF502 domain-containing protein [Puniceicoccales bacterium CK1056]|uniref:DUF502 domain-containing protein n=1 Tax=Oceanipulchritudo coccoides TaxID=2706888 RepID=A0A6B2M558_9BACT|nr:DUF502 domain-containing protein [Oceanipulchritudo coccoides]NDV63257.1 DUF502 domain-containing protein [Oceanipulchritudo coccoides]
MLRNLRNAFVSGLLLLAPVGVTFFVINFLIQKIGIPTRQLIFFFIPPKQFSHVWLEYSLYVAAIVVVGCLITLLGWLSKLLIGRILVNTFERVVDNVPVVRNVYNTVKQIRDTFVQQEKAVFQKSVLIEYPRKGIWVLGFMTGHGKGEIQAQTHSELINVFIPTTPNPTSGFLLMVPKEEVRELDMSIPDAMKLIISGGAVVPPWKDALPEDSKSLQSSDTTPMV